MRLLRRRQPLSVRRMSPVFLQLTWKKRGCSSALRVTRPLSSTALCPGVTKELHLYAHIQESTVNIESMLSSTSSMLTHCQSRKQNVAQHAPELPTQLNSSSKSAGMKKSGMIRSSSGFITTNGRFWWENMSTTMMGWIWWLTLEAGLESCLATVSLGSMTHWSLLLSNYNRSSPQKVSWLSPLLQTALDCRKTILMRIIFHFMFLLVLVSCFSV